MTKSYCKFLTNCLSFHQTNIRLCTTLQQGELLSTYQERNPKELAERIKFLRHSFAEKLKNNSVPDGCANCIYKKEEDIEHDKINQIDLYHWFHCNCGCFYCSYIDETKGEFSDKEKEGNPIIFDTIKELYNLDQISKEDLFVNFGGGDLSVLKEFPKLVDLFLKNNVHHVWCESSGIKYSKTVEKLLKNGKGTITVAVCSGNPETYAKIKKRDKYKQVMQNLKNYQKAACKYKDDPNNPFKVISKFIILEGFNNNIEEVEKWLLETQKYGIRQVEISMEFCWGTKTKAGQKIEDYNYEIFDYVEKRCNEMGLALKKNDTSLALMQKGVY